MITESIPVLLKEFLRSDDSEGKIGRSEALGEEISIERNEEVRACAECSGEDWRIVGIDYREIPLHQPRRWIRLDSDASPPGEFPEARQGIRTFPSEDCSNLIAGITVGMEADAPLVRLAAQTERAAG